MEGNLDFCVVYKAQEECVECLHAYYVNLDKLCEKNEIIVPACSAYSQSVKNQCLNCVYDHHLVYIPDVCEFDKMHGC